MIDRTTAVSTSTLYRRGASLSWSTLALAALVSLAVAGSASADQYAAPNKITSASSRTGLNLVFPPGQTTSVDLTKSRKKMVLVVHASAKQDSGATPDSVSVAVRANGILLEPGSLGIYCPGGNYCTASGTFFLDMEQAEAAHPGVFYNKLPMNVEVTGSATTAGANGSLSLVAELLKR